MVNGPMANGLLANSPKASCGHVHQPCLGGDREQRRRSQCWSPHHWLLHTQGSSVAATIINNSHWPPVEFLSIWCWKSFPKWLIHTSLSHCLLFHHKNLSIQSCLSHGASWLTLLLNLVGRLPLLICWQPNHTFFQCLDLLRLFPLSLYISYIWTQCPCHLPGLRIHCVMEEIIIIIFTLAVLFYFSS